MCTSTILFYGVLVGSIWADIQLYDRIDYENVNPIMTFESVDAMFGPGLLDDGVLGQYFVASPLNGCKKVETCPTVPSHIGNKTVYPILLLKRGSCEFDQKILAAQDGNYFTAIVYNNMDGDLIPMGTQNQEIANSIHIPSVFTTLEAGETLKGLIENNSTNKTEYYLLINSSHGFWPPTQMIWPFAAAVISCLFIMLVSTVVKLVRDWRKTRRGRLSRRKLNTLPVIKFNPDEHSERWDTCAICLEDFKRNDKVRELPCLHGYHKQCIDPWLTSNRKICPLCKQVVLPSEESDDSDSEEAPLLQNQNLRASTPPENENRVEWARGLVNSVSANSNLSRERTDSEASYSSPGEVNDAYERDEISQNNEDTADVIVIRNGSTNIQSDTSSNDGDDEGSPRQLAVTI